MKAMDKILKKKNINFKVSYRYINNNRSKLYEAALLPNCEQFLYGTGGTKIDALADLSKVVCSTTKHLKGVTDKKLLPYAQKVKTFYIKYEQTFMKLFVRDLIKLDRGISDYDISERLNIDILNVWKLTNELIKEKKIKPIDVK